VVAVLVCLSHERLRIPVIFFSRVSPIFVRVRLILVGPKASECAGVFSHFCKTSSALLGENDDREMQNVAKLSSYKHETVSIQIAMCR
jgi:hypothetical protein